MLPTPLEETLTDAGLRWRLVVPPGEHPIFAGHFPGYPVLPGVIILGWMTAATERFLGQELDGPRRLHNVKFALPLLPGQEVEILVTPAPARRFAARVVSAAGIHASVVIEPGGGDLGSTPHGDQPR